MQASQLNREPPGEPRGRFIASLPVRSLAAVIATGALSAVDALKAYQQRAKALNAELELNAVIEWLDEAAEARSVPPAPPRPPSAP